MINVLIVDDHKILRDGIKAILSGNKNINIIGECSDGAEVADFIEGKSIDVVLMDIKMPKQNGIETTKQLLKINPNLKVLTLSMHNEETYIVNMLKAGASGYILKNTGETELFEAINKVYNGEIFYSLEVANVMMSKYMNNVTKSKSTNFEISVDDLTRREKEIIVHIANELTNQEIAERLFISPRTVDTHRRNLLQKLGVKNTAGLVKFAMSHNML